MNELDNQYVELKEFSEVLSTRAGSLVKVSVHDGGIKGILGLYCNGVSDILTPEGVKAILFDWRKSPEYHEPNESFEWYKHNRKDIVSRLKLLEVSR